MSAPPADLPPSLSTSGHEDGLGRRTLTFDREAGGILEHLHLRPELKAFEPALRERVAKAAAFEDERFARVRSLERNSYGDLIVASEFVAGNRVSDLLETLSRQAGEDATTPGVDTALGFLLEVLPALSALHTTAGFTHGAVAPGRIVLTPAGQVVLLDSIFGRALERLQFSRTRLWTELQIAVPADGARVQFEAAGDIGQAALTALMLVVGRLLRENEYPNAVAPLVTEVIEIAQIRGSARFATGLAKFFQRTLPLPGRKPYASADEAITELRQLAREIGVQRCRTALASFIKDMNRVRDLEAAGETVSARDADNFDFPGIADIQIEVVDADGTLDAPGYEPVVDDPGAIELDLDAVTGRRAETDTEFTHLPAAVPAFEDTSPAAIDLAFAPEGDTLRGPAALDDFAIDEPVVRLPEPELPSPPFVTTPREFAPPPVAEIAPALPRPAVIAPAPEPVAVIARVPEPEIAAVPPVLTREPAYTPEPETVPPALVDVPDPFVWRPAPAASQSAPPVPLARPGGVGTQPPVAPWQQPAQPASVAAAPAPAAVPPPAPVAVPPVPLVAAPAPIAAPAAPKPEPESSNARRKQKRGAKKDKLRSNAAPPAPGPVAAPAAAPPPAPGIGLKRPGDAPYPQPPTAIPFAPAPVPSFAPSPLGRTTPAASAPIQLKVKNDAPSGYAPSRRSERAEPEHAPTHYAQRGGDDGKSPFPWKLAAGALIVMAVGVTAGRAYLPGRRAVPPPAVAEPAAPPKPVKAATGPGGVAITTEPTGAKILVDGKSVGVSPLTLDNLTPGKHTITFATGSGTVKKTVQIESGRTAQLDVPIYSGWIAVFSPFPLDIAEKGHAIGTSEQGRLMLPPGRHDLTLTSREFNYTTVQSVDIEPGEERSVTVQPVGEMNFNATPWAEVWIDGKKAGETPIAHHRVLLGTHEIVFKHPQLGERRLTSTVIANTPITATVDFNTPQ